MSQPAQSIPASSLFSGQIQEYLLTKHNVIILTHHPYKKSVNTSNKVLGFVGGYGSPTSHYIASYVC